ncbi:kinesin-domain-containing protein [Terfezia boudieri ATCC MYA-4762]|uniref:Kinesin-domain-containing protein n=1 Tax=Terfezia boudieri ATCC MYA-4762 TaxID=1051890 RepID=A0A3N4LFC7_9PEZI|nr:kinesin-domain-containing protein [Terfezia boudieri ATCC MYA-4762]
MSGPSRQIGMRKSTTNFQRAPAGPRPSTSTSNVQRAYLSGARSAQQAAQGLASPTPSVQSVSTSGRGRAASPTLKRKERDFEPREADDSATNITVVVRCRGRNAREIAESSGVVLSTPGGLRGKEVILSLSGNMTAQVVSSQKTYTFDRVFPPEADQAMVYDDVVDPILKEMLDGYNCTIFAYGQTGTGKTYTMSGDMTESHGSYSETAGIIPRVLYNLFNKLEGGESTVKCSFLELYNEELRDLLSIDETVQVKIFDDSSKKKAIIIQGMEETYIKSAEEGSRLLQNGSYKRQVAATKCNDLSSRSHTVFTITVHVKVLGDDGEEILRTGKLNLVDLAGSENVGRSGAENKRAREAGMINQSLLTLGRVINALVDKASHVPYRESKLTRLLQDSLGGQTKTCIIATVSPAKINLEETMSTLDYATRAKNIKNKPQVNQLMTKKALIKEYVHEIEHLKADLAATRQRNGVFLDEENYTKLLEESESRRVHVEEQGRKIEVLNIRYDKAMEEHRHKMKVYNETRAALQDTKEDLDRTKGTLEQTEKTLVDTQQSLVEETALRQAHEKTEGTLDTIGTGLMKTLGQTVSDIDLLQEKIQRKYELDLRNKEAWSKSQTQVQDVTQLVESMIKGHTELHTRLIEVWSTKAREFIVDGLVKKLEATQVKIQSTLEGFSSGKEQLLLGMGQNKDALNEVFEGLKILREEVKVHIGEGLREMNDAAQLKNAEILTELAEFQQALHRSYSELGREFKIRFDNTQKHMTAKQAEIEKLRLELASTASSLIDSSSKTSSKLNSIIAEEKERSDAERQRMLEQITAQITSLVNANAEEERRRLSNRIALVRGDLDMSNNQFAEANSGYNKRMMDWTASEDTYLSELIASRENLKTKMVQDWEQAEEYSERIQNTTQAVHAHTTKLVEEQIEQIDGKMRALDGFVTRARAENEGHHERFTETFNRLANTTEGSYGSLSAEVDEMKVDVEDFGRDMETQTDEIKSSIGPFAINAQQPLAILRSHISGSKFAEYSSTGASPRKRSYNYPNKLPRTEPHEEILANLRKEKERRGRLGFSPTSKVEFKSGETTPVNGGDMDQHMKEVGDAVLSHTISSTHVIHAPPLLADTTAIPSLRESSPVQFAPTDTLVAPELLVNSSINTHTFTHHGVRQVSGKSVKSAGKVGLKELNPNVDVGTYRMGITPASVTQPATGTLLDLQPPLKKQTVEKKLRRLGRKEKDGENNVPPTRRRGAGNA